jgi:hypothetical protein
MRSVRLSVLEQFLVTILLYFIANIRTNVIANTISHFISALHLVPF